MMEILKDLSQEEESLEAFVEGLSEEEWETMTPSEGWTIKDSVAHLAFIEEIAAAVLSGDTSLLDQVLGVPGFGFNELGLDRGRKMDPSEVLQWWRTTRLQTLDGLSGCDPKRRIPWFAGPLGARTLATARLMETWAHGVDCYEALGVKAPQTDRVRHVAMLAYLARPYSYEANGLPVPSSPLRLELVLPSGAPWTIGPQEAGDRIQGNAVDFCRVAVRRLHWTDADLKVQGKEALRFLQIVQAYAGPAGPGRGPSGRGARSPAGRKHL